MLGIVKRVPKRIVTVVAPLLFPCLYTLVRSAAHPPNCCTVPLHCLVALLLCHCLCVLARPAAHPLNCYPVSSVCLVRLCSFWPVRPCELIESQNLVFCPLMTFLFALAPVCFLSVFFGSLLPWLIKVVTPVLLNLLPLTHYGKSVSNVIPTSRGAPTMYR